MSWRMKISLYSPKLSRSSQAATSSVPHFWTTKVKSKTPLISTCSMHHKAKVGRRRCRTECSSSASKGKAQSAVSTKLWSLCSHAGYQSTQRPDHTKTLTTVRPCLEFLSKSSLKLPKLHNMHKKLTLHH